MPSPNRDLVSVKLSEEDLDLDDLDESILDGDLDDPAPRPKKKGVSLFTLVLLLILIVVGGAFMLMNNESALRSFGLASAPVLKSSLPEIAAEVPAASDQAMTAPPTAEVEPILSTPQPIINSDSPQPLPAEITTAPSVPASEAVSGPVEATSAASSDDFFAGVPQPTPIDSGAAPAVSAPEPVPSEAAAPAPVPIVPEPAPQIADVSPVPVVPAPVMPAEQKPAEMAPLGAPPAVESVAPIVPVPQEKAGAEKIKVAPIAPEPSPIVAAPVPIAPDEVVKTEEVIPSPVPEEPVKPALAKVEVKKKEEKQVPAEKPSEKYHEASGPVATLGRLTEPKVKIEGKNLGDYDLGLTVTSAKPATTTAGVETDINAANRALDMGRLDAALEMFSDLYRKNPRDERILMGRAVTLQKLGRTEEAIKAYDDLAQLNPDNPDVMSNMLGLMRKQYPSVALQKLLDLRQKYPNNPTLAAQIGLAQASIGNLDEAMEYLAIASRIESGNPKHYFNMAIVAEKMGKRDLAIQSYERALEADAIGGVEGAINRDVIYDRLSHLRH